MPLLEVTGVSKHYGGVTALDSASFAVERGSVHGLLGKNGAGKSTLVSVVAGSVRPDNGTVHFRGRDVTRDTYRERRERGIELLRQHAEVFPTLTVAENIMLPRYPAKRHLISWKETTRQAEEILDLYGVGLSPGKLAQDLTVAQQRKLNIIKSLSSRAALIMLDEPTTALTLRERDELLSWIRTLADQGETFVYISHISAEVRELCDELTVLRDGKVVSRGQDPRTLAPTELSTLVTGENVKEFRRATRKAGPPVLDVQDLRANGVGPVNLQIGEGEVVGFGGFPGSGAREAARALGGLLPASGSVFIAGTRLTLGRVKHAIQAGITYLTHDRLGEGLVEDASIAENAVLGRWPSLGGIFLDREATRRTFYRLNERLALRASSPSQEVKQLSGGNQQKVLLARLLEAAPKVLILDEPTLGVDVGAKEEIHRMVDHLTDGGTAVIVLAYDTDEMVRLVDRMLIFHDGVIGDQIAGADLQVGAVENALSSLSGAR